MRKKILLTLLAVVSCICLVFGVAACNTAGTGTSTSSGGSSDATYSSDSTQADGWEDGVYTAETAYALATSLGYEGTLEEFIASIAGEDGLGISSIALNDSGELVITLTDGSDVNLGTIAGADGKDGTGITSAYINDAGELVLVLTDETEVNCGSVTGTDGNDGKGIASVTVNEDGELEVTYTDGTSDNLGVVVGSNGEDGNNGKDGVGISTITINDSGELVIALTSGTELNLGTVVGTNGNDGNDGVSVTGASIDESGVLILTLSNGNTITVGTVVGTNGEDGKDGKDGKDGVGISTITINDSGELVIALTSGTELNLGTVVGTNGEDGNDGVSVTGASIDESGVLILTLSNGNTITVGTVVGTNGEDGKDGVGISTITINDSGELVIALTSGTELNLGTVVGTNGEDGNDGVSVTGASIDENGVLILTLSNGNTITVGTVVGTNGEDGKDGVGISTITVNESGEVVVTYTNGDVETVGSVYCSHSYGEWQTGVAATCTSVGYNYRVCGICGDIDYEFIAATGHTHSSVIATDDYGHTYYCTGCGQIIYELHDYGGDDGNDTDCSICGAVYSAGLYYALSDDETYYTILYSGYSDGFSGDTLIIPAIYNGLPVREIGEYAFQNITDITSVYIPASVVTICEGAFTGCTSLKTVTFGSGSNLTTIGAWAFCNNSSIKYITIPDGVVSIGNGAFDGCSSLKKITIPASVTALGEQAFEWCSSLTSVTFADGCELTYIASYAFYNSGVTSIELPDTVNIIHDYAFCGTSITTITIPDIVTYIGEGAFNGTRLTEIVIPASVTELGANIFHSCYYLTNVTFEDGINLEAIPAYAFAYCNTLEYISLPQSVTSIGEYAFLDCGSLEYMVLRNGINSIGEGAATNMVNLTTVILVDMGIDEYVNISGYENFAEAGAYKESGTTIYGFWYDGESGVYVLGSVMTGAGYLELPELIIDGYYYDYEIGGGCFAPGSFSFDNGYATSITSVYIPACVTAIRANAFSGNENLQYVTFASDSRLESIGEDAFGWCTALVNITIPASVSYIGERAFCRCDSIEYIDVEDGNAYYCSVDGNLYDKDVTTLLSYAYSGNSVLTIPETVTAIADYAVAWANGISQLYIPASVNYIGYYAFGESLYYAEEYGITYGGTYAQWTAIDNDATNDLYAIYFYEGDYMFLLVHEDAYENCMFSEDPVLYLESYSGEGGDINLPQLYDSEGNLATYSIGNYTFASNDTITGVVIPEGVTCIWESAFYNCYNITNIEIPASVTYIGMLAFAHCNSLLSVTFADGSLLEIIGLSAFYNCYNLTSIVIPANVTSIGDSAFRYCEKLVEVYNLSDLEITAGSTDNGYVAYYAFAVHSSLDEDSIIYAEGDYVFVNTGAGYVLFSYMGEGGDIILPELTINGTSYTYELQGTFYGNGTITSVYIPACVTSITNRAFYNCWSLISVTFAENSQLTEIGDYAFYLCYNLESIDIPASVTYIGDYAFYLCWNITSVTFGEDSQLTQIGNYAFQDLGYITSIVIPANVTVIGDYAFYGCTSLLEVYNLSSLDIVAGNGSNGYVAYYAIVVYTTADAQGTISTVTEGDYEFTVITTEDGSAAYSLSAYNGDGGDISLPSTVGGNTVSYSIMGSVFDSNNSITSVYIPACVTSIGHEAFNYCEYLASVTFEDGSALTSIGDWAFYGCWSLNSIVIPSGVTYIGMYAFSDDTALESIVIPASVTVIGAYAFEWCTSLTSVTFEDGNTLSIIDEGVFYRCTNLASITLPASVTSIGYRAFYYCTSLTGITIPEKVTSIGKAAFYRCTSLTSITIPENVTSIGERAFGYCYSLASVEIPVSLTEIGYQAFYNCDVLTDVYYAGTASQWASIHFTAVSSNPLSTTPGNLYFNGELATDITFEGITSINAYAFYNCTSLTSVYIPATVTYIGNSAFYYTSLTSVTFEDGSALTEIADYAFAWNASTGITSFAIPGSVTSIGSYAFAGSSLTQLVISSNVTYVGGYLFDYNNATSITVYYEGSADEWAAIADEAWAETECEAAVSICYYAEADSTTAEGNYWYYDTNGDIITWSV